MMLDTGAAAVAATTPGGGWLVAAVMWPVVAVLLAIVAGGRHAARITLAAMPVGLAVAWVIATRVWEGGAITYLVGGWAPPLGIALRADGLSAAMMLTTAIVITGAGLFAHADFAPKPGEPETRGSLVFWTLLIAVWGAMNLVVMSRDLFNLYVALELLTFAAVPLVSLDGRAATLAAALRYLMFALLGSVLYLLGAVLLYGAYGTLDISLLAARVQPEPVAWVAAALMTAGLLAKTALFPLHLWLPPAHAGAPPAASAVLSALVVKGSFVLLIRLWFEVMPALWSVAATQLIAALGAAAILYGSVLALRQERLKLLIAYSTVAQIGYLFLMFPLAYDPAIGAAAGRRGAHRRRAADRVARLRQGRDVHGRGPDRQVARARPHRRSRRRRARAADEPDRVRPRRRVARGPAAERRVRRQVAAAVGGSRHRPVVVGGRAGAGRPVHRRLRDAGARARDGRRRGVGRSP